MEIIANRFIVFTDINFKTRTLIQKNLFNSQKS